MGTRQNGFVLILVIAAMAVIGAEMFILAGGSNAILFQSDCAYLQAYERNLIASGLAWAKRNIKTESKEIFNKRIELDIADMKMPRSTLSVIIDTPENEEAEVQINTSYSRRRRTLTHDDKYRIELRQTGNVRQQKK